MKVTALIPDEIVHGIKQYTGAKNITESLVIVLSEWLQLRKIKELNATVKKRHLQFSPIYSASKMREINRR